MNYLYNGKLFSTQNTFPLQSMAQGLSPKNKTIWIRFLLKYLEFLWSRSIAISFVGGETLCFASMKKKLIEFNCA